MPCEKLAIATGQMQVDLAKAITGSLEAQEAMRQLIAQAIGVEAATVFCGVVMGGLEFVTSQGTVTLTDQGRLLYRGGWAVSQEELEAFKAKMQPLFEQLGMAVVQEQTIKAIGTIAPITSDRFDARTGARLVKVRL